MGEKREKRFFPETHVYREQKTMKKIVWEKCENTFFYKHTNIVTKKCGEKTREKNFSRNTRISLAKKMEKNRLEKVGKQVFYKHTNIVTKNRGETREKNFQKTHE